MKPLAGVVCSTNSGYLEKPEWPGGGSLLRNALYPKPEENSKGAMTKWENKVALIQDIYTGPTNYMIAGTAWGALNAMTERLDWYRVARKGSALLTVTNNP